MARMEPVFLDCPGCGEELHIPVRLVPTPDTDLQTANFTVQLSREAIDRHLERCPASAEGSA